MRGAGAIALAAAAVLVATLPLAAQQRRVLHGDVTLADDSVLADAAVRFVFVARGGEAHDATDDVTVHSDAKGRFRAELLGMPARRVTG